MPEGGCFCGATRIKYTGDVQAKALCHCADCRKMTGSTYSTNIIVPSEGFSVTKGNLKKYSKKADSGKQIDSHFCGDCGSTLYRAGETFGDNVVIKVGVMDDANALDQAQPAIELYVPERVKWVKGVDGASQLQGMPGSAEV